MHAWTCAASIWLGLCTAFDVMPAAWFLTAVLDCPCPAWSYRPLGFYMGVEVIFFIKHLIMLSIGFVPYKYDKFLYYVYGNWAPQDKGKFVNVFFAHLQCAPDCILTSLLGSCSV